ncbi:hypothetical protein AAE02nite_19510 [Adhaeribacter aerolatus]|uniref:Uncharacterized protein n=1 Tax=Adhaeribacter aerolatus TaxID=670289 RepID=A0A512AXP6_9BACT|nr:MgtC/SapB family protein [Adhaeribacter aerolatus]GEO04287.1 hypothetical protein AAE02nite_19510 [Adhaeribacter aerolatus]
MQDHIQILGISLGLGLLVGLQRQMANSQVAGIRTFPMFTMLGTLSAFLSQAFGGWILAAGFISVTALLVIANLLRSRTQEPISPGQTTEAAVLLMYGVGAYLVAGDRTIAIAIGGLVAVLLHFKKPLHGFIQKVGYDDSRVVMQFVLISLVILPILPNQAFGPYRVLNPHDIWLMVVLIVGIGMCGYFAYKFFGKQAGTLLGGILGGLISSTATTVSYARRTKHTPDASVLAAYVILTASTVAFLRIIVEIIVVAPRQAGQLVPPLAALFLLLLGIIGALYFWNRHKQEEAQIPEQGNPAELKSAFVFAGLYALVMLGTAAARDYFGNSGLYAVGFLSGLTDVDAITLSTAKLVQSEKLHAHTGWQVILIAALSNLLFKGAMVAVLGHRRLFYQVAILFSIAITGGLLMLWFWPQKAFLQF